MKQLIECVPNFSEGQNMQIINQIVDEIKSVDGVKLLDVDPGKDTNRTVMTFVGTPDKVCEAAFRSVNKSAELIDMRKHKGAHPRFGATDVLPLIPISNISMEETVKYAQDLGKRIGKELGISVYLYEHAATETKRKNLSTVRAGEYEGLNEKLANPDWQPDFGPNTLNPTAGAMAVGARNFLIAYNINLNTTSTRRANAVAFDVRENGRLKREGNSITGKIIRDKDGNAIRIPGSLKAVKAIGWFIEEYGIAQISINLTDITVTSIHQVFDEVCKKANERGLRVTGSELVGLVPLKAILDAGKYFLKKQNRSVGISDDELIKIAVKSLGLDELKPFDPNKKIIEYMLDDSNETKLIQLSVNKFTTLTASESPAPGGGSISASIGAFGAALSTMVANLSAHKRGWDERWEEFSDWAEKGKYFTDELLKLVDEDTNAFNKIMEAFQLPKKSDIEKKTRLEAIEQATKYAIEIPYKILQISYKSMNVIEAMAKIGNPNSVSDAGVGALAARTAVMGAYLNVKINCKDLSDKSFVSNILSKSEEIVANAQKKEKEILAIVNEKI